MAWRDEYQRGSFRNVPFRTKQHTLSSGRRIASDYSPGNDVQNQEDTGKKVNTFQLEVLVFGKDYFGDRDALKEALDEEGPGRLVHPYLGIFTVRVPSYTLRESTDEGGVARFSITFVEGEEDTPKVTVVSNPQDALEQAKYEAYEAINTEFTKAYDPDALVGTQSVSAIDSFGGLTDAVNTARQSMTSVAEYQRAITQYKENAVSLVLNGANLAASFQNLIDVGSSLEPTIAFRQFVEYMDIFYAYRPTSTVVLETAASQMTALTFNLALAAAAGQVAGIPFKTAQEAEEVQDTLFAAINEVLTLPNTPELVTNPLRQLKAAVIADLNERVLSLPQETQVQTIETMPVLVLAYDLYGNTDRVEEIIDRNKIEHAGFCPANYPLRVVDYGNN